MIRALSFIVALLFPALAFGQGAVLQGGPWAVGHAPQYTNQGSSQAVIGDSGPAGGGGLGLGLSELNITSRGAGTGPFPNSGTGPLQTHGCFFDTYATSPAGYHYLCFDPNSGGGGLIAYGAAAPATALPLYMNLNGVIYQFPFVVGGIVGPVSTTVGDIAVWNNGTGTLLADGGVASIKIATIAALSANTIAYPTVHLQGYYSKGDGGGGDLEESASCSPNGVTTYNDGAGHCYTRTVQSPINVLWGGVKRDGSTDNTTNARNIYTVASALSVTQVYWPGGGYCINSGIALSEPYIRTTGTSLFGTIIENCGANDDPIFDVVQGYSYFEHIAFLGLNKATSTNGTIKYENTAVRGTLDDILIYYGGIPFDNLGGSVQIYNSILSYGFQQNLYSGASDLIVRGTFFDVPQPYGSFPSSMANWSSSRSTVANYLLKLSTNIVLQYSANCTTGGSEPIAVAYQQNITDGTCTAQIVGPAEMVVIDSDTAVNYFDNCDFSGAAWAAGIESLGSSLSIENSTVQPFGNAIYLNGGSQVHLYNDFGNSFQSGASGLTTTSGFSGDLTVTNSWFSSSSQGINLSGGAHIQLLGNGGGNNSIGLSVSSGASYIQSGENNWGGSSTTGANTTGISLASGVNHFHSVNDDAELAGTAVSNSSSNTDISFDNLAGYSAYGTTPPAASTCGTSPAVSGGSSNYSGQFTTGTGTPTACTITFATSYPNAAYCSVTPANAAAIGVSGGTYISNQVKTAFTITLGTGTSTAKYNYACNGN